MVLARKRAILIAGPTASGKSALAVRLAERLGGVVINADSMAVYRDLSILTGRPDPADVLRAPHWLYGHRGAEEPYSVGIWLREAAVALDEARSSGRMAIVVGGTGLYFTALTLGLSDIPPVPQSIRDRLRTEAAERGLSDLHARLASGDPHTAVRLRPGDSQRILRALEVLEATGRPLSAYQATRKPPLIAAEDFAGLVIEPERTRLKAAIDRRFERMMDAGALEEVRRLAVRRLDPSLPAMRALGVRPLLAHLEQGLPLAAAIDRAKAETRAYAKRQLTFARHQLGSFVAASLTEAEQLGMQVGGI